MAIFRIEKNNNYSVMANYHFRDKTLSWKAKGILSNMLSLPDDWDYSLAGLKVLTSDGMTSTRSAIKELEEHGYLIRKPIRENGKIKDWDYIIYEYPQIENQDVEKPLVENPQVENPQVENRTQLNTNPLSTKKLNNNILSIKEINKRSELQSSENIITVFNYWNSKNIINHHTLTDNIEKTINKAYKEYGIDCVLKCIDRYATVYSDNSYYFNTKWTLVEFLKQGNAMPAFTDEGSKWLNYIGRNDNRGCNQKGDNVFLEIAKEEGLI